MTPRERAELIVRVLRTGQQTSSWLCTQIEAAINSVITDQTAALQAALEDLAKAYSDLTSEQIAHGKTMKERDELAHHLRFHCPDCHGTGAVETAGPEDGQVELVDCERCVPVKAILAAHDRQVAARVLRHAQRIAPDRLFTLAFEYEAGEREVPGE